MSQEHTPGPWEAVVDRVNDVHIGYEIRSIQNIELDEHPKSIAHTWATKEEDRQNAFLLAAAPRLLNALRVLKMQLDADLNDGSIRQPVDYEARAMLSNMAGRAIDEAMGKIKVGDASEREQNAE